LEVLSTNGFRQRKQLVFDGDDRAVAVLRPGLLPWEAGEKSRSNARLFYQMVLGTIDLDKAFPQLLVRYADERENRSSHHGESVLALAILDSSGCLVEAPAVHISSFAWGLPHALQGELTRLSAWHAAERKLTSELSIRLRRVDDEGRARPVDRACLMDAWSWLVNGLGLPKEMVKPPEFAIRCYLYERGRETPEPILLNSFFLGDLGRARALAQANQTPKGLARYLTGLSTQQQRNLLADDSVLDEVLSPARTPPARWPGPGRSPLVLLQQAAVNIATQNPEREIITAVNGPPGTGKTTLLRDLVAAVVTSRAEAMARFNNPMDAFTPTGVYFKSGQSKGELFRLDESLLGFEMVVASSNNKAVENVSAELPTLKSVADDVPGLRYFHTLSDALQSVPTWGLVAAVLGNKKNRRDFKKIFWDHDDHGLAAYLASAMGNSQAVEFEDPVSKERGTRLPKIVSHEKAPRNPDEARLQWGLARKRFLESLDRSRKILAQREHVRNLLGSLPRLEEELRREKETLARMEAAERGSRSAWDAAQTRELTARQELAEAKVASDAHGQLEPSLFHQIFRTRRAREWRAVNDSLAHRLQLSNAALANATKELEECERASKLAVFERQLSRKQLDKKQAARDHALHGIQAERERTSGRCIDNEFLLQPHAERQLSTPWLGQVEQQARDEVFIAAMALHKAFIGAVAKPLRDNLDALMRAMSKGPPQEQMPLLPQLWASLFLVVPLVSTTFASVGRMFKDLPPESLGWLIVDEAGQATPQSAVGALMRTRKAVVVGDPMQLEPVVTIPRSLTTAICRTLGVDPLRFNAPGASVQTLSDAATSHVAEFSGKGGRRQVGVPLLVHRRCSEPMFSLSNAIAYERLMVSAKKAAPSRIRDVLGPSSWLDVRGDSEDKWCQQEGELVVGLLRRLFQAGVPPSLYVITPFVVVESNLKSLLRKQDFLRGWVDDEPWQWLQERVGTIHTVQGREAEAVIFVLGAPREDQRGARTWAGRQANLLNVAVTRAKEQLYVVGNRTLWCEAGFFSSLHERLPPSRRS
jgi:hypothetical protein